MAFSDYTSPDSVRAVLGISVKEVSDTVVTNNVYLTGLLEAFRAVSLTLAADYKILKAQTGTKTPEQTRFQLLAETFCSYVVAIQLVPNLPLSAPQIITDGKAEQGRIANPYMLLLPNLTASLALFKANLLDAYSDINSAITKPAVKRRNMVAGVGLAVDPVTGA